MASVSAGRWYGQCPRIALKAWRRRHISTPTVLLGAAFSAAAAPPKRKTRFLCASGVSAVKNVLLAVPRLSEAMARIVEMQVFIRGAKVRRLVQPATTVVQRTRSSQRAPGVVLPHSAKANASQERFKSHPTRAQQAKSAGLATKCFVAPLRNRMLESDSAVSYHHTRLAISQS